MRQRGATATTVGILATVFLAAFAGQRVTAEAPGARAEKAENPGLHRDGRSPAACETESRSSLPGVKIRIVPDRCTWSRAELAEGVRIPYEVIVDAERAPEHVDPRPRDFGGCGRPGPSGLIVFVEIQGVDDDRYCLCDRGLCAPAPGPVELVEGTHAGAVDWKGRNWNGPSDVGFRPGEPFKAGEARVVVTAVGATQENTQFEVTAEMRISITP